MALTPILADAVTIGQDTGEQEAANTVQTSRTYRVDWKNSRITGFTDGRDALEQAIYKILMTERFAHLIYSWNYGFEMSRLVSEAVTADDRIDSIKDFSIRFPDKRSAAIRFTAVSVFGDVEISTGVTF